MGWFKKHKILTVVIVVIVIAVIAGAAGSGGNTNNGSGDSGSSDSSSEKTYRFNERADKQPKDVEVLPGEPATVDGVKMTLSGVQYTASLSEFEKADSGKTYILADVALENTSNETKPFNVFDFRIQTAGGQVLDGAFSSTQTLSSGDLVAGGKTSGKIVFEVPVEDGHQYVIWKPNAFNADRAIVQVK